MNEVHSPKKPLIFYYMVAMLLVMPVSYTHLDVYKRQRP